MSGDADVLPLDPRFQSRVLRHLCDDRGFAAAVLGHMRPNYFQNPFEAWALGQIQAYRDRYDMPPPFDVLLQAVTTLADPAQRDNTATHLRALAALPALTPDVAAWLRDRTFDFVRTQNTRATVLRAVEMLNANQDAQAYLQERVDDLRRVRVTASDRSDFFAEFEGRLAERRRGDTTVRVPTGFPTLDRVLHGGLAKGEVGMWVAYAKNGKTTMLTNLGGNAARAGHRVLHLVYEGRRQQVETRYDAIFAGYDYREMARGNVPDDVLDRLRGIYASMRGNLIIRGFTSVEDNVWCCSCQSIADEIAHLRQARGWVPDVVVIDYGDLLQPREKGMRSAVERQESAYRDMKALAGQGYAVWTASQPQRPGEDAESKPAILKSRQIADCYAKVRIVDFVGSINMTLLEREHRVARLYAEMYRDGAADVEWAIRCDLSKMTMAEEPDVMSPHLDLIA